MVFSKDSAVDRKLKAKFREAANYILSLIDIQNVVLFGSCARGEATETSDIDIAVLANTPLHIEIMPGIDWHVYQMNILWRPIYPVHTVIRDEGIPIARVLKEINI